jgi:hypothetical protein
MRNQTELVPEGHQEAENPQCRINRRYVLVRCAEVDTCWRVHARIVPASATEYQNRQRETPNTPFAIYNNLPADLGFPAKAVMSELDGALISF